jgi:hypothetical protein
MHMQAALRLFAVTVCILAFALTLPSGSEAAQCPAKPAPKWRPSKDELSALLAAHETWVRRFPRGQGCRAQLQGADLSKLDLSGVNLSHADLSGADVSEAKLIAAILYEIDLEGANLARADLSRAVATNAHLSGARLYGANLSGADLNGVHLHSADLSGADLREATILLGGLRDANLSLANLTGANLEGTDLSGANLDRANLAKSRMDFTAFWGATFEASSVDDIRGMEYARGLSTLRFVRTPTALALVRDDLRKRGAHAHARELTYAIRRQERKHAWQKWETVVEAAFNYGFFEFTCRYGLDRGRPLYILGGLIPAFSVLYMLALISPGHRGGIWRVWAPDRVAKDEGQTDPVRLSASLGWGVPARSRGYRMGRVVALGIYMSILSAFHIGWRELNVGTWIARLQPREYTLRTTGWVRFVSGLQSLISVYLVALWVLTYFGRPFD